MASKFFSAGIQTGTELKLKTCWILLTIIFASVAAMGSEVSVDAHVGNMEKDNCNCPQELPEDFCSEKADGLYAYPTDCTKFVQCVRHTTAHVDQCPARLYFDARFRICNWPDIAQCSCSCELT